MSNIVQLYDASNNKVYPVTHLRAVRDSSGTTLESMMQDVREITVGYYECSTPGNTAAKTITIDSSVSLSTKILCKVKFVEKNTVNNATMNINGTGAKALYYNGVRAAANNSWYPNEVVDLYYDGTNYQAKSCADTLEYDVSLHQTHEITEITTTTRTLIFNGNVVSSWESETPVSDSSVEGYTRSETNTGQDIDSTTVDGPNATYDSTANKTNVVYVTTHTYTHVVNNYTFEEAVNAVPMSYRHGGLKLRFISNSDSSTQSSDNKYVQWRLMAQSFTTNVGDWLKEDNTQTFDFPNNNLANPVGEIIENDLYSSTDFIKVTDKIKLYYSGSTGSGASAIYGYDEFKKPVQQLLSYGDYSNREVVVPSGIAYIICSGRNSSFEPTPNVLPSLYIYEEDCIKIVEDEIEFKKSSYITIPFKINANIGIDEYAGDILYNEQYSATDYIAVTEGDKIVYSGSVGFGAYAVAGYDKNHELHTIIAGVNSNYNNQVFTIPSGVAFIRCCGRNENFSPTPSVLPELKVSHTVGLKSSLTENQFKTGELVSDVSIEQTFNKESGNPASAAAIADFFGGSIKFPFYGLTKERNSAQNDNYILYTGDTYSRTDYVPVHEGDVILYSGSTGGGADAILGFDNNKTLVSTILTYGDYTKREITIPSGISYIMCCGRNSNFSPTPSVLPALTIRPKDYINDSIILDKSVYLNKKIVFLGDSIPHGQSMSVPSGATVCNDPFPSLIAKKLGMRLVNYGIGGSTIAASPLILGGETKDFGGCVSEWSADGKDISKYYVLITGTPSISGVGNLGGTTYYHNGTSWVTSNIASRTPITDRYTMMDDDADVIVVFCGTNDFQYNWTPIGTLNDNTIGTFYGAINILCKGLLEKYFGKQIIFCTPIKRCQTQTTTSDTPAHNGGDYGTITSKNTFDKTLKEYGDIIKEVCAIYSIPVIDCYAESGLNPQLPSQALLFDTYKTHPTQAGHERITKYLIGRIKSFVGDI